MLSLLRLTHPSGTKAEKNSARVAYYRSKHVSDVPANEHERKKLIAVIYEKDQVIVLLHRRVEELEGQLSSIQKGTSTEVTQKAAHDAYTTRTVQREEQTPRYASMPKQDTDTEWLRDADRKIEDLNNLIL
jgi:hypothetical protein